MVERVWEIICAGFIVTMLVGCNDRREMVRETDFFEITVADSETREPMEGVLFLGYWELQHVYGLHGQTAAGIAQALEAVTGIDGKIRVPHPKTIPDYVSGGYLGYGDPTFLLYKSGYKEDLYTNIGTSFHKSSSIEGYLKNKRNYNEEGFAIYGGGTAYWHGRTVYIERHAPGDPMGFFEKPYAPDGIKYYLDQLSSLWIKEQGSLKKLLPNTYSLLSRHYRGTRFKSEPE